MLYWFKLGFISFGGPAGQISMMHHELVEKRKWIAEDNFMHALNFTMLLPGPEAQQLATYLGWLMHGKLGGFIAGIFFILPSLLILIALSWVYVAYNELNWVNGFFYGVKPAVVAIVFFAAVKIGKKALKHPVSWMLALISFASISLLKIPFPYIIISAAAFGFLINKYKPTVYKSSHAQEKNTKYPNEKTLEIERQENGISNYKNLLSVLSAGIAIWLLAFYLVPLTFSNASIFKDMSLFFTKAALVTFGGAYAVLPYVYQNAVDGFQWLSAGQMIDGLALGESTPGPLIMVVTFVGFVAGWSADLAGIPSYMSAVACALVATFFTFLPSFIFIFIGAPFVEITHNNPKFKIPLMTVTSAVIGVIASLGVFFSSNVFWPNGFDSQPDRYSILLGALVALVLSKKDMPILPVIFVSGITGIIMTIF